MLNLSISGRSARGRPAGSEPIMPAISLAKPVKQRERLGDSARVAAHSLLIMAVIVAVTFAVLIALDYAGIQIAPTGDMLAAG